MRKYEKKQTLETIKKLASKWPMLYLDNPIVKSNHLNFCYEDLDGKFQYQLWSHVTANEFKILEPEITLEEAREHIKTGIVYSEKNNYRIFNKIVHIKRVNNQELTIAFNGNGFNYQTMSIQNHNLYPFDPTPFRDLLEEIEEEKPNLGLEKVTNLSGSDYTVIARYMNEIIDFVNNQQKELDKLQAENKNIRYACKEQFNSQKKELDELKQRFTVQAEKNISYEDHLSTHKTQLSNIFNVIENRDKLSKQPFTTPVYDVNLPESGTQFKPEKLTL